jgi:hypothetical protein
MQNKIVMDSNKLIDVYGNGCKRLDLGLLVVSDQ